MAAEAGEEISRPLTAARPGETQQLSGEALRRVMPDNPSPSLVGRPRVSGFRDAVVGAVRANPPPEQTRWVIFGEGAVVQAHAN